MTDKKASVTVGKKGLRRGGRGIVLNVTEEIINVAIPRDSGHCVLADALSAALPEARRVTVDLQTIRWTDPAAGYRYIYLTPGPLQAALANFDLGIRPAAGSYRLGNPIQVVKTGGNRKRTEKGPVGRPSRKLPEGNKTEVMIQNNEGSSVIRLGGTLPPTAALSNTRGRRRTYGLKSLKSPDIKSA